MILVDKKEHLYACLKGGVPCRRLVGYLEMKPLLVTCMMGKRCGNLKCGYYEPTRLTADVYPPRKKKSKVVGRVAVN